MLAFDYKMESGAIVPSFIRQLELCNVKAGDTVVFLTDEASPRELVAAGLGACVAIKAVGYEIRVPHPPGAKFVGANPVDAPWLADALRNEILVVSFMLGFFSAWELAVRQAGGRILNILDIPQMLLKLQGDEDLKRVTVAAADQLNATKSVRVTSAFGTDFTYEVDHELGAVAHYGFADHPGHMDQWGQGMAACFPVEGSTRGKVVARPGDIWALPYTRILRSEIIFEIEDGHIVDIQGGDDADLARTYLAESRTSDDDRDPYAVSHLGWGLHPNATYDDVINYDGRVDHLVALIRSLPGSFLFSTGPSPRRKTRGHIDMPLMGCTVTLDNREVVKDGRITDAAMIA